METVLLVILLIVALALVAVVLLQRSEGGGLGMGGGGVMSGRAQATALSRATWMLGGAFMVVSLLMTVIAAENAGGASVVDRVQEGAADDAAVPDLGSDGGSLLPPGSGEAAPAAPLVPVD
jgi:preprotein translocase subunit SecG